MEKQKVDHLVCPICGQPTYPNTKFYDGGVVVTWKCTEEDCPGKHEEDVKK